LSALGITEIAASIALFGTVAAYWLITIRDAARHEKAALKEHARAVRGHYAAIEA
jgi:hypothetical protein